MCFSHWYNFIPIAQGGCPRVFMHQDKTKTAETIK